MDDPKSLDINYGALLGPLSIAVGVVFLLICIAGWICPIFCRCLSNIAGRSDDTHYNRWLRERNHSEQFVERNNDGQNRERWTSFSNMFGRQAHPNTQTGTSQQYAHDFNRGPASGFVPYQSAMPYNEENQRVSTTHGAPTSATPADAPPAYSAIAGYQNYFSPQSDRTNEAGFHPSAPPRYETLTSNNRQ